MKDRRPGVEHRRRSERYPTSVQAAITAILTAASWALAAGLVILAVVLWRWLT